MKLSWSCSMRWLKRPLHTILAVLLLATSVAITPPRALAASDSITWDSRADFETNAGTTGEPVTQSGIDVESVPGAVRLKHTDVVPIIAISAGSDHTVGLKSNGTVVAVGGNYYGQLNVSGWTDIVATAASWWGTVGLKSNGTVVAASQSGSSMLNVSGWTDIIAVSAGGGHTVGLKSNGTVVAAGSYDSGQLNARYWTDIVAISAGSEHTVGLKSDGTVRAVGRNDFGQCNVSGWRDIVAISAGSHQTVGLKSDGTVVAVGNNGRGELNVSGWRDIVAISAGSSHTVGLKSDGTVIAVGYGYYGELNVSGWADIVAISAGGGHTVGLKSNGTVVAVGSNGSGQCNVTNYWSNITGISAGGSHTVGLKSDGTVVAVGWNYYGQLNVSGWRDIVAISAGSSHTVGLKSDGTVVAVGWNDSGQLNVSGWTDIVAISAGLHSTVGLKSDGTVVATRSYIGGSVAGWTDIVAVSAGLGHFAVGLKGDGTVVAVGGDDFGRLNVSGWTDIVAISTGSMHTVGLKSDGTVVAVGSGDPGLNESGWTDIVAIAVEEYTTVGLKSDGTVVAMGSGDSRLNESGWTDIVAISARDRHTVGAKSDGTVVAVGANGLGQCDVWQWTSVMNNVPRIGTLGGEDSSVGLRGEVPHGLRRWTALDVVTSILRTGEAVKLAVRLSDDGVAWSEPLGHDGEPINWASGTGNYLGRAGTDASARTDLSALRASRYVDIVVRLETRDHQSPEVMSIRIGYELNDPPVAVDDAYETAYETALVCSAPGVLANDTDIDGDPLTAHLLSGPASGTGTVTLNANGSFTYTPPSGFLGAASFTYRIFDGTVYSPPATVAISVLDTTPPAKPVVTLERDAWGKVTVKWNAVSDVGSGVASYQVYRDGSPFGSPIAHGPSSYARTYADLAPARSYAFKVRATDKAGNSTDSDAKSIAPHIALTGETRYHTAIDTARLAFPSGAATVILATGENFPDALAAAPLAGILDAPILLVPTKLSTASRISGLDATLAYAKNELKASKVIVLGGDIAISPTVYSRIVARFGSSNITRYAGDTRYDTANLIIARALSEMSKASKPFTGTAFLATGANFPDALAAAPISASNGWPVFLTKGTSFTPATKTAMQKAGVKKVIVLGGGLAIDAKTYSQVAATFGSSNVTRIAGDTRYDTAAKIATLAVAGTITETSRISVSVPVKHTWDRVGITTGLNFPDALAGGMLQAKPFGTRGRSVTLLTNPTKLSAATESTLKLRKGSIDVVTFYGGELALSQGVRTSVLDALK